jgi:hypothetical protein
MVEFITVKPDFDADPTRCFKLPFNVCEALCLPNEFLQTQILFPDSELRVFSKILHFITLHQKDLEVENKLNTTLGGYLNKVFSFWLLQRPAEMVDFFIKNKERVLAMIKHLYLGNCVSDLLIRICCVKQVPQARSIAYNELRQNIL